MFGPLAALRRALCSRVLSPITRGASEPLPAIFRARHVAWNTSTSGIERLFGKTKCATSACRSDVSEPRLDDELQLLSLACSERKNSGRRAAASSAKHLALLEQAQAVWAECFGPPRCRARKPDWLPGPWVVHRQKSLAIGCVSSSQPTIRSFDRACPLGPKRAVDENSESSWLKRRRVAIQEAADGVDAEACMVPEDRVVGHDLWELSHEREREFQEMKEMIKRFQAVSEGAVSWSALNAAEQETCAAWWSHHDHLDRKHLARPSLNKFRREPPNLIGHTVWYEEGVLQQVTRRELDAWTRALGLRSEESPLKASIHVCSCATSPANLQLLWPVALSGKRCMDVEFLRSAGRQKNLLEVQVDGGHQEKCFHYSAVCASTGFHSL